MATSNEVNKSIRRILNVCGDTLLSKGKAYSGLDEDRLQNFKDACEIWTKQNRNDRCDQKTVLWGYLLKHLSSIRAMCKMVKHAPTREEWDEKLCDAINYLLLLSAMVDEELANETEPREGLASNNARSIYKANKEDERMITNAQD